MRFKQFKIGDTVVNDPIKMNEILTKNDLHWLIDSEIEDADIEIKNKTLIWNNGSYNAGHWHYGIWKYGQFNGVWENGIWEKGHFGGEWKSGIGRQ